MSNINSLSGRCTEFKLLKHTNRFEIYIGIQINVNIKYELKEILRKVKSNFVFEIYIQWV